MAMWTVAEILDRNGNVDSGGDLGQVQENLREECVHRAGHLKDTSSQGDYADLVTFTCQKAVLEALDELLLQILLQTPVIAGQGDHHWVHRRLKFWPAKLGGDVDGGERVGGVEQGAEDISKLGDVLPIPCEHPLVLQGAGDLSRTNPSTVQSFSSLMHLSTHKQAFVRDITVTPSIFPSSLLSQTPSGLKL